MLYGGTRLTVRRADAGILSLVKLNLMYIFSKLVLRAPYSPSMQRNIPDCEDIWDFDEQL